MNSLFSLAGALALEQLRTHHTVLAFDLDGTLAPLVAHRADASLPPSTARRMTALMRDWPVAVITGRAVDDARVRLNFQPHYLLGNHGAEFHGTPHAKPASFAAMTGPKADHCLAHCRASLSRWAPQFEVQGVAVEDKGLSIAIHYRQALHVNETEQWLRTILSIDTACLSGLEDWQAVSVSWGHKVVNIVPTDAPNKGHALLEIMNDCGASTALMVGDDANDEAAFAVLPAGSMGVRVGVNAGGRSNLVARGDDSPTAAHFNLSSQTMVEPFLDLLLTLRR
jgi:trehalose 6-phosphate phosphatase